MEKKAIQKRDIGKKEEYAIRIYSDSISDGPTVKVNCKVCTCPCRSDIEKKYTETKSYQDAFDVLAAKNITDISYHAVRRHLITHFLAHEQDLMVKEYAENLSGYLDQRHDKRTQILERIKMIQKQMYKVGSMAENANLLDNIKSVDALKKAAETILLHEKEIESMDRDLEPVTLLMHNFRNIIQEKAEELSNQGHKTFNNQDVSGILSDIFTKLMNSVEGVLVRKD